MVDGDAHKAGLQLSRHLISTCYTVEWLYTYVSIYCRCVPTYEYHSYKNSISLYSIYTYIYIYIYKQCLGSYSYAVQTVVV